MTTGLLDPTMMGSEREDTHTVIHGCTGDDKNVRLVVVLAYKLPQIQLR